MVAGALGQPYAGGLVAVGLGQSFAGGVGRMHPFVLLQVSVSLILRSCIAQVGVNLGN